MLLVSDNTQDAKDRYGRLLRYVMKSGKDVNRMMVARGHARVDVYDHKPFKRVRTYNAAQTAAKRNDRGLWRVCGR